MLTILYPIWELGFWILNIQFLVEISVYIQIWPAIDVGDLRGCEWWLNYLGTLEEILGHFRIGEPPNSDQDLGFPR